ncbi:MULTISPECIES: hypothetical protein [unclassified Nostoc]|uniref:hypothetical protein n=1 Tax=unclassified Nostoc TaxID=2593658 RepID=UPI002AD413F0|nr:hypothetical protein [Nostoc sp. DedQUE03]MDZ7977559.1 hypothetical protein [Nostoc sp. DedQUE03]MDZ8049331.1 hypothetical protein [Nostoc sp. DedQUE02]
MTANQVTVHPSTVSIPAPIHKLGQVVRWTSRCTSYSGGSIRVFKGVIIEQVLRVDAESSYWQYTAAVITATQQGRPIYDYFDSGEYFYDLKPESIFNEKLLTE